jgi:translocation and assembly module TamB
VFHAAVALDDVDVRAVMPALPTTTIHGTSQLTGRGSTLGSLDARLVTDLGVLMVDSAEFRDVVVRARANDGLLTIDTLRGTSAFGAASASGTLGVVEGREGAMQYRAEVSDLNGLARWIATGDTGAVAARPLVGTRLARLGQRLDSIHRATQARTDPAAALVAELREADEKKGPAAVVPAIPRDSIAGSLLATGEARGSIAHLDVSGTVTTPGLVWGGSLVGAGRVDVRVSGAGKPAAAFEVGGAVDSLRVAGFALDSTRFTGTYRGGEGEVEVAIFPGDTAEYRLGATYALRTNEGEVRLRDIRLRFDSTAWTSVRPSTVSWRGQGIAIDSLELRNHEGRGGGRIFVNGEVPDADPGRLDVAVDSLRLAPWLTLLQSDVRADGVASFTGTVEGTRRAPRIDASLRVSDPTYQGTEFPELAARIEYDARSLVLDGRIRSRQGGELAHVTGTLPIDLSLGDPVRTRRVDAPLALTIEGDSIPLSPLTTFTGAVAGLDGRAYGRIEVGGTWERPRLGGGVGLEVRRVALAATGVQVRNVTGQLRMTGDSLTIDSLVGESEGRVQVTGRIALPELTEPRLDLALQAFEARILRNDRGSLVASGDVRVSGPVDTLSVTGRVTVNHGVVNIPDPERLDLINTHDPAIFAVVDTATARRLDVAPPSATRRNLRLDVDLDVQRGVFARSPHANVEVFGNLGVRSNPSTGGKLVVTGALYTDRGDYQFMGKRFVVTRGSVRFTGEPDPNPALQVIAIYEVRQARRAPLDIRVVIGGTLDRPQLALESESQPTLSQSDLIAFLAFGQSSTALVQFAGTGLEAEGHGGSSLAGNVGAAATRQLASVALGALVDEARVDLTRATRADVVNITPAQIPEDLSSGELQALLFGTELEMGKYLDRDTFLLGRVRPSLVVPGVSLERRFSEQFRVRANFETRLQSQRPSLGTGLTPRTLNVFGAVLRWSISW